MHHTLFLKKMQQTLDATGQCIRFCTDPLDRTTVAALVRHALNRSAQRFYRVHPTEKVYANGRRRKQKLGDSRSLQDLYLLVRYYLPETTIFEVRDVLNELVQPTLEKSLSPWRAPRYQCKYIFWMCTTHRKIMFSENIGYDGTSASTAYVRNNYGITQQHK